MSDDITIKLQPSAEEIAQEICRLYNMVADEPDTARIEFPAGHLHTLAIDHHKRGDKLLEIRDKAIESIRRQQDLVAEISRLMEGGDA